MGHVEIEKLSIPANEGSTIEDSGIESSTYFSRIRRRNHAFLQESGVEITHFSIEQLRHSELEQLSVTFQPSATFHRSVTFQRPFAELPNQCKSYLVLFKNCLKSFGSNAPRYWLGCPAGIIYSPWPKGVASVTFLPFSLFFIVKMRKSALKERPCAAWCVPFLIYFFECSLIFYDFFLRIFYAFLWFSVIFFRFFLIFLKYLFKTLTMIFLLTYLISREKCFKKKMVVNQSICECLLETI